MNDITKMVFQQSKVGPLDQDDRLGISLLNILWAMDGKRSVSDIAKEDAYDLQELTEKVQGLLAMGLIEASSAANKILDARIMDMIFKQMAHYTGPVAEILVHNCSKSLGHHPSTFPSHLLEEFLQLLSEEIQDEKEAEAFKQSIRDALG